MKHVKKIQALAAGLCVIIAFAGGCHSQKPPTPVSRIPKPAIPTMPPTGDEIIVCGQRFHTGAPVVLWLDKGGYNFRYSSTQPSSPGARIPFNVRRSALSSDERERVLDHGWTLELLRDKVDQFVIHYDVAGVSRTCFNVLNDRYLAVQFMLDIDGTIYQTMDLEEQAAHATKANGRSVGIEIANMGAYSGSLLPLLAWYKKDAAGNVTLQLPERLKGGGVRTQNFVGQPARNKIISGNIQGTVYRQYDFTPQQYDSLTKLTAALCTVFPKITCDYPREKTAVGAPTTRLVKGPDGNPATRPDALAAPWESGALIPHALTDEQYDAYHGVLGHYHVQTNKEDPGPAFQWDRVIDGARKLMTPQALMANGAARDQPARTDEPARGGNSRRMPATRPSTRPTTRSSQAAIE